MTVVRRTRALLALALTAAIAATTASAPTAAARVTPAERPAAQAASPSYVALGDSYASGLGTRRYLDDGTACKRSVYAHPSLIAAQRGWELNFRACAGATVRDVTDLQLDALGPATGFVTVSVGGNDSGFAEVLTTCALPSWASNCPAAIDAAQRYIRDTLPGTLSTLYGEVRSRAPQARVVVSGYPRLFMGEDCNALTWFSPAEMRRLNETADLLNRTMAERADAAGVGFANPTKRFLGHAVCDDVEWINGLSAPVDESYHPNRPGQSAGYQPVVSRRLTGTAAAVTPTTLRRARAFADELAATQRAYAERDRTIDSDVFEMPDLVSPDLPGSPGRGPRR